MPHVPGHLRDDPGPVRGGVPEPGSQRPEPAPPSGGGGGGGSRETVQDILRDYRAIVETGSVSNRENRLIKERLEAAGLTLEQIDLQMTTIFDTFLPQEATAAAEEPGGTTGGIDDDVTFTSEVQEAFDPFLLQEERPGDVFTKFLGEILPNISPLIRGGAQGQLGDLFSRFSTGLAGGFAGEVGDLGEAFGQAPTLFADFLRGGPQGAFFESDPRTALRNIAGVFGTGSPADAPSGASAIDAFFNPTGTQGRGRIAGAIGSPLLGSINPFFRSAFQTGISSDLDRLLANDPGANPFAAFQQGGFF